MTLVTPNCVQRHTAFIYDRGGKRMIDQVRDISMVSWGRTRDNVSDAMIRIEDDSCRRNARVIREARTHRHELVIFRGENRVWEGPLHRIASEDGSYAELHAKDVLNYAFYQPLTQRWSNAWENGVDHTTEVTTRIGDILEYELSHGRTMFYPSDAPDAAAAVADWTANGGVATPVTGGWNVVIPAFEDDTIWPAINVLPSLDVRHFPNEARTAAVTEPFEMSAGLHLQNLARFSGIDFTTVGRRVLIWDVSRGLGVLPTLTTADFTARVIVTEYGADHTQAAYVIGSDGTYGQALNLQNLAYYGPWTTLFTSYNEEGTNAPTAAELNSQARRNLSGRSPAPIEVRVPDNSSIILNQSLGINDLIPGVQVPLRAAINARQLTQLQKIDMVRVVETPDGEDIKITLTPATRADSDVTP